MLITVNTNQGRLTIHRSRGHALLPICRPPSTALAAYVNPSHFGLVWPTLTLHRRAMTRDLDPIRPTSMAMALPGDGGLPRDLKVDMKLWPWMWPDVPVPRQQCARRLFLCPAQERAFTDDGALHGSFDPRTTEPLDVRIAFRLCPRECRGLCHGAQTYLRRPQHLVFEY